MDLEIQRHSLEHVMTLAVRRLFGSDIPLGVGPVIEYGFYQDFDRQFSQEVFAQIEQEMRNIIEEDLAFVQEILSTAEALKYFQSAEQPYKVELLRDIERYGTTRADRERSAEEESIAERIEQGQVSLYSVGSHRDLCRGPHVARTGMLKEMAFRLDRTAGAYWRGSEKNRMLCRIYALAFESEAELEHHLALREEAKKRDHRKLGEELELFFFHDTAPGMAYWLPKGMRLKNLLITYWRQYHEARGYQEIGSPLLNKRELWEISGHWRHYQEDMMLCRLGEDEQWALKPMNCANAMLVWKHRARSYKELPLRLSDTDTLHRNERTGSLAGLFRARCFCQDDAHNFVSAEQIGAEIERILQIVRDFYGVFGLADNVRLFLATRPDDFMGDVTSWDLAERELADVLKNSKFQYAVKEKDGAFYGPKIDIHLQDALGRQWQCGTIQLDFQLPRNFGLEYVDKDGAKKTPVVIHRVIYGSLERFVGIILEHFAGRLPFWSAPVQLRVLPVKSDLAPYVEEVVRVLSTVVLENPVRHNELRFEVDDRVESLSRRVRDAELQKIPVCLVVGVREQSSRTVMLRSKAGEASVPLAELRNALVSIRG